MTLNEIVINDGSHLVVETDQTVTDVLGDGRSMIHVAYDSTLNITGKLTAHAHIYEGASIELNAVPDIELISSIYVSGSLTLSYPTQQSLILADPASVTLNSSELTNFECQKLEVQTEAELIINNDAPFTLNTPEIVVDGKLTANIINITENIESFTVGNTGQVSFDPITSEMYFGKEIDIRGKVDLGKFISVKNPCDQFLLEEGTLTWPGTDEIATIECAIVKVNGVFSPGVVSFGSGVDQLTVGSSGTFTLTADGPVRVDSMSIAGKMYVKNLATFESHLAADERIQELTVHHPNGLLSLNTNGLSAQTNSTTSNQTCNILKVKSLTVDKTFTARELDIDVGVDDVTVNRYGTWTFDPCDTFRIYEIYTNGTITSSRPLTLKGKGLDKVHEIHIEYGGKLTLDSTAQTSKAWTGTSVVGVHDFKMYGAFLAGRLRNYVSSTENSSPEGWDNIEMLVNGTFYFESDGQFLIDYMSINGHFETYSAINMTGSDAGLIIHIASKGKMKFDSVVSSGWTNESFVTASEIKMDSGSYWESGNTKWDVIEAKIDGNLRSYPSSENVFVFFTVESNGNVDFSRTSHFKGHGFNVNSGGTMDIAYQHTPEDVSQGMQASTLLYKTVDISGTLKAGSLYIGHLGDNVQFCENVYISGNLDVSQGGYLHDTGPGKFRPFLILRLGIQGLDFI